MLSIFICLPVSASFAESGSFLEACKQRKDANAEIRESPEILGDVWDLGCEQGRDALSAINGAQGALSCALSLGEARRDNRGDEWIAGCKHVNRFFQERDLKRVIEGLNSQGTYAINLSRDDVSIEKLEQMNRGGGTRTSAAYDFCKDKIIIDENSAAGIDKYQLAHEWAHKQIAKRGQTSALTHEWTARAVTRALGLKDILTKAEMEVLHTYTFMGRGKSVRAELEQVAREFRVDHFLPQHPKFTNQGMAPEVICARDPFTMLPGAVCN